MKNFIQRLKNARKVVSLIKAGEFEPYLIEGECHTAKSSVGVIWLANGPFFCEMMDERLKSLGAFGLLWRWYVWFAAARGLKRDAERKSVPVL